MAVDLLTPAADLLPAWAPAAIDLLKPALGVMARPVIINNFKRVAAHPGRLAPAEVPVFLDKVRHGIQTFAATAQADLLTAQLRSLILR